MNNQSIFTIKDLENLSGIKAHTIRIWEKRYNVLNPDRTDTNIRLYDVANLQKLLNITLLHNHGYKISAISKYKDQEIPEAVQDIISNKSFQHHAISAFKMAMIQFDQTAFYEAYDRLLSEKNFREIFKTVFIPLLNEVGMLWQSGTVSVAQEHFLSNLIKQKLVQNIAETQANQKYKSHQTFVLFLPFNEIHDLGLLYVEYEVIHNGHNCIYLGESVPLESMNTFAENPDGVTFICYASTRPERDEMIEYINLAADTLLKNNNQLWMMGRLANDLDVEDVPRNVKIVRSLAQLESEL